MFQFWLAWRYLTSGRAFKGEIMTLGVIGISLGVAALVVAMAVVSGYQSTLRQAVIDVTGHLMVNGRGPVPDGGRELLAEIEPHMHGQMVAATAYVHLEAIIAHEGQVMGVMIEGLEQDRFSQVLNLGPRLREGAVSLTTPAGEAQPSVMIGQSLAQTLGLGIGDELRVVIPVSDGFEEGGFRSRLGRFQVAGILDLGRHEFNLRYVAMDLEAAQNLGQIKDYITGFRIKLQSEDQARPLMHELSQAFGMSLWVRDWQDVDSSLFEAAELEKMVIFFILLLMIIAASFTVASTLFISVVRRYRDISILKAMGATQRSIRWVFIFQGLLVGAIGAIIGLMLGLGACWLFLWAQEHYQLLPAEVYKLEELQLDLRFLDLVLIFFACLLICFLATIAPARRGAKLPPVEGLRYE